MQLYIIIYEYIKIKLLIKIYIEIQIVRIIQANRIYHI